MEYEAIVNYGFTRECKDRALHFSGARKAMVFGLFRRREPEGAAPEPASTPKPQERAAAAESSGAEPDSAREILELLELELGGMIRQLERAAASVASGADATAMTLTTIRARTDALAARTSSAQDTA